MNSNNVTKTKRKVNKTINQEYKLKKKSKRTYLLLGKDEVLLCDEALSGTIKQRDLLSFVEIIKSIYDLKFKSKKKITFESFIKLMPNDMPLISRHLFSFIEMKIDLVKKLNDVILIEYNKDTKKTKVVNNELYDFFINQIGKAVEKYFEKIELETYEKRIDISEITPLKPTKIKLGSKIILEKLDIDKANHRLIANIIVFAHRYGRLNPKGAEYLENFFNTPDGEELDFLYSPFVTPSVHTIKENTKAQKAKWTKCLNNFFMRTYDGRVFLNPAVMLIGD